MRVGTGMAAAAERNAAASVVAAAAARLRATSHLYFELEPGEGGGMAVSIRHHRPEDLALAEYGERFWSVDPLTRSFRDRLERGLAPEHRWQVVSLGELPGAARRDYENRFGRRAGIADVIGLGVPVAIGGRVRMICFGFHRGPGDPAFSGAEKRALVRLADGLRLRGENLALRDRVALQGAVGRLLYDAAEPGWVLLDEHLRVRDAGGADAFPAVLSGNGMREVLRRRLGGSAGERVVVPGDGADRMGVVADPVPAGGPPPGGNRHWWLVRPAPPAGMAELTAREGEVMRLLATGRSNPELARALGVTINTVENHLRSIYGKLGVRSRSQAMARLLVGRPRAG